jgi:hypothetical protein
MLILAIETPRPTRAQRGAEAAREILPPSRGIDARSLAAKPPQAFTIRRVDETPSRPAGFTPRVRGGFSGNRGERGGFVTRGRGGTGVRGSGGARGAAGGRGRGGKRPRGPKPKRQVEEDIEEPWKEEELAWLAGNDGGWPAPYVPKTSLEQFIGKGPSVISSPRGVVETAVYKMQVATDNVNGPHRHADEHLARIRNGHGTLFESAQAKAVTQEYLGRKAKLQIQTLPKSEREKLSKAWIAGHYAGPPPADKRDILAQAEAYARRNETYLPEDSRKLQAKLASLLPVTAARPATPAPARKPL